MTKISILIVLLPHLCTILCNETSNNVGSNQSLETKQLNNDNECGIGDYSPPELVGKMRASPGDWPWLVAIFTTISIHNTFTFQCAGTLLTNRHILTTALCVKGYGNFNKNPKLIKVTLRQFNLPHGNNSVVINWEVKKYVIHPDYAHYASADSDLAILTLKTPIEFSTSIRPICLWSGSTDLQDVVNRIGYVAGWGINTKRFPHDLPEKVEEMRAPIVSQAICHQRSRLFSIVISNRTFCAGERGVSGLCDGVRGSGLVLLDNTTNRYQLRGVFSRSVFISSALPCKRDYVVYVDVAKYLPWIRQQISTT